MKVGFFTPRSTRPLHARLVAFDQFFKSRNIQADFIHGSDYTPTLKTRLNWLWLWFFDMYAVNRCKPLVRQYDVVFVTDMKYLPLVKYARKLNKIVIYDTIDHNVYLRFYQLEKKIKGIGLFKKPITSFFEKLERHYAFTYCHEIIVNSRALAAYFDNRATILFYSSPLENLPGHNQANLPTALVYLGIVSYEKGFTEIVALQQKLQMPLYVFGDSSHKDIQQQLETSAHIVHTSKLSVGELGVALTNLRKEYYLVGFSLIRAAHYSYEIQEANKDIDYLALGIPIIGNERLTTREKIDAGCGLFYTDAFLPSKLNDASIKETMATTCRSYYDRHYASPLFDRDLGAIIKKYISLTENTEGHGI